MSDSQLGNDGIGSHRGVAVGIVTSNDDPEGLGRVRVRYPWRESEEESYWARIAMPMAGSERGTYFLPEVDDEVLVAFDSGDINHPYVIGSLWNGEQPPPEDNADGNNDVRTIRSRSGHEITFDDAESGGKVEIATNGGHRVVLDDETGGESITIEDSSGQNSIAFDAAQGSLEVSSGTEITLDAPMLSLSGDGNVTVEAGGILTLKGALVKIN